MLRSMCTRVQGNKEVEIGNGIYLADKHTPAWEYVIRVGTETGYNIGRNRDNCNGCGSMWNSEKTAPLGALGANRFGLYDVHGNVCGVKCFNPQIPE